MAELKFDISKVIEGAIKEFKRQGFTVSKWISCKEQLPEVGQPVLIYYPYWTGLEVQAARLEHDKLTFDICGEFNASVNKVTHWQPLPEPPTFE